LFSFLYLRRKIKNMQAVLIRTARRGWSKTNSALAIALRLSLIATWLVLGVIATFFFPLISIAARRVTIQYWCKCVLILLGIRVNQTRSIQSPRGILVSNHISWLDPIVICALSPGVCVAKSECMAWPFVGLMLRCCGTVFVERQKASSARYLVERVRDRIRAANTDPARYWDLLIAFPEGTTTRGEHVAPFAPAIFYAAIECDLPIYPVAIAYQDPRFAFIDEQTLLSSIVELVAIGGTTVHLHRFPYVKTSPEQCRKKLALEVHNEIEFHLKKFLSGQSIYIKLSH
jgi:1-acyl-sn-glycerol-3-phosphate acyltransferase